MIGLSAEPAPLTCSTYLCLDDLLGVQSPRTEQHDELLFVIIHQVYELWCRRDLDPSIIELLAAAYDDERGTSAQTLSRSASPDRWQVRGV